MIRILSVKKMLPKLAKWWMIGTVLLAVSAIVILKYRQAKHNRLSNSIASQTVLVKSQNMALKIQANGVVRALRTNNLSPEAPGKIAELYVREGDRVAAKQIVARMDDEKLQAEVNHAKASLQKVRADLERIEAGNRIETVAAAQARVKTARASVSIMQTRSKYARQQKQRNQLLIERGAISRNAFNNFVTQEAEAQANLSAELARLAEQQENLAEIQQGSRPEEIARSVAEVAEAQAELRSKQIELERTVIRAPFEGIITRRYAEVGDYVDSTTAASETEGATSTSIAELNHGLEIEAKIPEVNIAQIDLGQTVDIKVDAYNQNFTGTVRLIAPTAVKENNVTSFRVKVALETGREKLKSGMNAKLTFMGKSITNATTIPVAAVVTQEDGQTGVYLAGEEHKPKFKLVELGITSGNLVRVVSGLIPGDRVLLSPPEDVEIEGVDTVEF